MCCRIQAVLAPRELTAIRKDLRPSRRQLARGAFVPLAHSKEDIMSKTAPTLTAVSHFSWHQYDFHYGSFTLHALAASLEAAVERVDEFLRRLQREKARGNADRFIDEFDAADVPLAFHLRNHGSDDVSFWITASECNCSACC
jgi:hypothetical protein